MSPSPFSPENLLVFMTGPLTGTSLPKSSRYILAGISPLTGIWGQAHAGGSFPDELRHAGFDGLVLKGQAERPVYLWVHDQKVEVRGAEHLWGKDIYEAADLLRKETDKAASPACIGPAGERLVRYGSVISDGREGSGPLKPCRKSFLLPRPIPEKSPLLPVASDKVGKRDTMCIGNPRKF